MLKNGDMVRLKTGGCLMTVADLDDYPADWEGERNYRCVWFCGAQLHEAHFREASLNKCVRCEDEEDTDTRNQ